MTVLSVQNLTVSLNSIKVLRGVNFTAQEGQVTGLIGPNGAGKSTLLRAIIGLIPHKGVIEVQGRREAKDLAKRVSYLPQLNEVHWPMTARGIVSLGRYPHGRGFEKLTDKDEAAITRALKAVDGLKFAERDVLSLSAGERARVLLARALAVEAPILLADEPVASLDPEHQLKVMETLKDLAKEGAAVVIVLHDLTLASRYCDQLTLLNRGQVEASGTPAKVLTPKILKSVYKITAKRDDGFIVPWQVV